MAGGMMLLPPELLEVDGQLLADIDRDLKSIYRLIVFSEEHHSAQLLTRYQEAVHHLQEVLSIKNAQMESQSEEEALRYLTHLKASLLVIVDEIAAQQVLSGVTDLFRLFRAVAPEAAALHPNQFRQTQVHFGPHAPPSPAAVPGLVQQLFEELPKIPHPVTRASYFHHELVRIHPFVDGNGRVSRMGKNWLLMYELYPPIFIYSGLERKQYIQALESSFLDLLEDPFTFGDATRSFFEDELRRTKASLNFLLQRMLKNPDLPFGPFDFTKEE